MIKSSIIKEYLKNPKKNYLTFDIKYSKKESEYLDNLNINKKITFDHFGNIDDFDHQKLNDFIKNIGDNQNIEILSKIVKKILTKVTSAYQTKFCWLTIRVTIPSHEYDIPRWHKDGTFFTNSDNLQSKFVTVLKGPGTMFVKKSKLVNEIYNKNIEDMRKISVKLGKRISELDKNISSKFRRKLAVKFEKYKNQIKTKKGLVFYSGTFKDNEENGLIHSEPILNESRLFISILPGNESELYGLIKRWGISTNIITV
jgi:hypothetical protein